VIPSRFRERVRERSDATRSRVEISLRRLPVLKSSCCRKFVAFNPSLALSLKGRGQTGLH